jgi:hypothetical protein
MDNLDNVVLVDSIETGNEIISDYTGTVGNYRFDATLWKVLFDSLQSIPEVLTINLEYGLHAGSFMVRYRDSRLAPGYQNQHMCESWDYDQPFKNPEHVIWFIALRMIIHTTTGKGLCLKTDSI